MTRLKASADLKERLPVSRAVRPNAFRKVLKLYRFVCVIRPKRQKRLLRNLVYRMQRLCKQGGTVGFPLTPESHAQR